MICVTIWYQLPYLSWWCASASIGRWWFLHKARWQTPWGWLIRRVWKSSTVQFPDIHVCQHECQNHNAMYAWISRQCAWALSWIFCLVPFRIPSSSSDPTIYMMVDWLYPSILFSKPDKLWLTIYLCVAGTGSVNVLCYEGDMLGISTWHTNWN